MDSESFENLEKTTTESLIQSQSGHGIYHRIWEMELLISGAVVFALFQFPSLLDSTFKSMAIHVQPDMFRLFFLGYFFLLFVSFTLSGSFLLHLVARAYWIGMIGLYSVFNKGIKWRNVSCGPFTKDEYKTLVSPFPDLIRKANSFCNLIFSFSFMIVAIFAYSIMLAFVILGLAYPINRFLLPMVTYDQVFWALFIIIFGLSSGTSALDKIMGNKIHRLRRFTFFKTLFRKAIKTVTIINCFPIYGPTYLTFYSNFKKKYIHTLFLSVAILLFAFVMFRISDQMIGFSVQGYVYFPQNPGKYGVDNRYYRSERADEWHNNRLPSIQSDIIYDAYVKLFIPFKPDKQTTLLSQLCPDIKQLQSGGLSTNKISKSEVSDQDQEYALHCLAKLHRVFLNGNLEEDLDFMFYREPGSNIYGIITYIDSSSLYSGKNVLKLIPVKLSEKNIFDSEKSTEIIESSSEYIIPFYISR